MRYSYETKSESLCVYVAMFLHNYVPNSYLRLHAVQSMLNILDIVRSIYSVRDISMANSTALRKKDFKGVILFELLNK